MTKQRQPAPPISSSGDNKNEQIPPLHECVQRIKNLGCDRSEHGSKHLAQLFTSCLGFLAHIHLDRITIEQDGRATFPSTKEIPAISLLLQDCELFKTFLSMLRSKSSGNYNRTSSFGVKNKNHTHPAKRPRSRMEMNLAQQKFSGLSKKRSLTSLGVGSSETVGNKMAKIMGSPLSDKKEYVKVAGMGPPMPVSLMSSTKAAPHSITANFAVFAAITFFSAFQYLDQWPAILVKTFAEDCFGSKTWVGDERCDMFVQNLMLAFKDDTSSKDFTDNVKSEDADKYFEGCNSFLKDVDETCTPENPPHQAAHIDTKKQKIRSTSIDAAKLVKAVINTGSDSDSGDEKEITSGSAPPLKKKRAEDDGASSSSGEEEEVSVSKSSLIKISKTSPSKSNGITKSNDWWYPKKIDLSKVRSRFFGPNKANANSKIGDALSKRLDAKVKQNSGLLTTLPNFVSVPGVRKLASGHLEKWLQSPALSGLARNLFSHIVAKIQNIDPPLPEDVSTISNILSMNLKANQFNIHVEKVIQIVRNVPTSTVCHQVTLHLLTEELKNANDKEMKISSDISAELRMLETLLTSLVPKLAYSGLASALLSTLYEDNKQMISNQFSVEAICGLIGSITSLLGNRYDGYSMVDEILNCEVVKSKKLDFSLISRLVFECMILMVPKTAVNSIILSQSRVKTNRNISYELDTFEHEDLDKFASKLLAVRKVVLRWCLSSYSKNRKEKKLMRNNKIELNEPRFSSVLDGETTITRGSDPKVTFVDIIRCLLFLTRPDSEHIYSMLRFGSSSGLDSEIGALSEESMLRIQLCMRYGCNIDNNTFLIITKSAISHNGPISALEAISLMEEILNQSRENKEASFLVDDCNIIWEMYKLAEYKPNIPESTIPSSIPRLACPGLWWRVTAIALVLCGRSPQKLGADIWKESPTIQALIKMVTSGKFRFPTADCDEIERERMRHEETNLKEKEYEIAEILFFPTTGKSPSKSATVSISTEQSLKKASRTSVRQRERKAQILAELNEREKAREKEAAKRRKLKLRKAQKSIMLFNPRSGARKPRKESVQLLFSVDTMFNLSEAFKACKNPDFILLTIGSTSRDGIERAYDWLIPTISSSANIINRLPPSASCFLLLRAYGAEGNENNQLLALSSPLLKNVHDSITGDFGREGAQRAGDILFFDLADEDSDRRRCARRVLQESLVKWNIATSCPKFASAEFSWLIALTETKYAASLVSTIIPHLMRALDFEKGQVLRAYVMTLHYFSKLDIKLEQVSLLNLSSSICKLLSSRPKICIAAMDRFEDFRAMMIHNVVNDFKFRLTNKSNDFGSNEIVATLSIPRQENILIPLSLIRASLVLIGNWDGKSTKSQLMDLVTYFIPAHSKEDDDVTFGAASATVLSTKKRAVSIEDWVMLAKSNCDLIAKRSVLSVPGIFLPRLLLCCGLPQSSFITIIRRLDKLGESNPDEGKIFRRLLKASTTGELGGLKRSTIARMLLGRISAYMSILSNTKKEEESILTSISSASFISWLKIECDVVKQKLSLKKRSVAQFFHPASILSRALDEEDHSKPVIFMEANDESPQLCDLNESKKLCPIFYKTNVLSKEAIEEFFNLNYFEDLDTILQEIYENCTEGNQIDANTTILNNAALNLIINYRSHEEKPTSLSRLILYWIPILSKECDHAFWEIFFYRGDELGNDVYDFENIILTRCLASWSTSHLAACQLWILNEVQTVRISKFCIDSFLRCFVCKVGHSQAFGSNLPNSDEIKSFFDVLGPKDRTESAVKLALLGAQKWSNESNQIVMNSKECDWMALLLLIGRIDKKHLDLMTGIIVSKLPSTSWEGNVLPGTLLKLYASYPTNMNLGSGKVRDVLVKASTDLSHQWLEWKTPFDSQLESLISFVSVHSILRQQQLIIDLTKRHPLITVKHLNKFADIIAKDAEVHLHHDGELRVRQNCNLLPLFAQTEHKQIQVKVLHWGMSFTEPLWLSILDIIASFPDIVIFSCGWLMGLEKIFNSCLKLLVIQADIGGDTQRLRNKFVGIFKSFHSSNRILCSEWIETKVLDFNNDKVKDILVTFGVPVDYLVADMKTSNGNGAFT